MLTIVCGPGFATGALPTGQWCMSAE